MVADSDIKFSVVIPCYNEEGAIRETLDHLASSIDAAEPYELIVVDDGSTDGSLEILQGLAENFPHMQIVTHGQNRGYGAALKTGIRRAKGEFIVITDADGTYPNHRIPELVRACQGIDMVVGARPSGGTQHSPLRAFPKYFLRIWMSWIAGQQVPDVNSGLRVFRKRAAERFLGILPDGFSFTVTITLAMMTNYRPVLYVPIEYHERVGQSKIRPVRDTVRFFMLILRTGTYFAPLRIFAPVVLLLLGLSLSSLVYDIFVLSNLTDKTVLLFLFAMNTGMFALLADMIDKRAPD